MRTSSSETLEGCIGRPVMRGYPNNDPILSLVHLCYKLCRLIGLYVRPRAILRGDRKPADSAVGLGRVIPRKSLCVAEGAEANKGRF
jgi:hypothetical protein